MMKSIAIIPARGGSKRIPDKNITDFCGKPMIAYPLEAARDSGLFDTIHVSTESQRIINVVESLGFSADFLRPAKLADDHTPIMPVLKYVTETYRANGKTFDRVCLIMACAPLIEPSDLKEAAALFDRFHGTRSVLAVAPYPVPIEWAFSRSKTGVLLPVKKGAFAIRSQDFEPKYYDAGSFAYMSVDRVLSSEGAGPDNDYVGYVLPRYKAIDIDEREDMALAVASFQVFPKERFLTGSHADDR